MNVPFGISTSEPTGAVPTGACIEAIACALPKTVVTNADLARENPSWDMDRLFDRTGVRERHIAAKGETALDLGLQACQELDARGELRADAVDALIFCTETPDHPLPPNACLLHERLGLGQGVMAFDITLACSGFVYALGIARSFVDSGTAKRVLIVTADTYSRLIHPGDRSSRCLFGDGAAATIVGPASPGEAAIGLAVVDMTFGTCGAQNERFVVRAGGARLPRSAETASEYSDRSGNVRTAEHIEMDGLGVLSFFNTAVPRAVNELLARNGLAASDVGAFVFHQASKVAVEGVSRRLALDPDQLVLDMESLGNLVSASVPVALLRAQAAGRIPRDQPTVLCGFGVGLSWATALLAPSS